MKKAILYSLLICFSLAAHAQLNGDGFYRVQNTTTGRYVKVSDNRGELNYTAATADLGAIRTIRDFENVVSDPGTIIYIEQTVKGDDPRYDLKAQGTGVYSIIGHYVQIKETRKGGTYKAFATAYGQTAYIADEYYMPGGEFEVIGVLDPKETKTQEWWIKPVNQEDNMYFGVTPEWNDGSNNYSTLYASFPFSFQSEGMKAYYVSTIDSKHGIAVWKEVEGDIPASMPVIISCKGENPANNRLNIHTSNAKPASDNLLRGIYFDLEKGTHANRTPYDPTTMRVFGQLADGTPGFKKADISYVPANTAYLPVPANAPDELKLMTPSEYEAFLGSIDTITIRVNNATKAYGEDNPEFTYELENAPEGVTIETLAIQPTITTEAGKFSDVGTYTITASGAAMDNCVFLYVDGTLTITEAPVVIRVNDATKVYGQENPQFSFTLENAPENVTAEMLQSSVAFTTEATKTSPVGEYAIKASGASMKNCAFTYVDGTLTITAVSVTIRINNASKSYGEENPQFSYTLENAPEGVTAETLLKQPTLSTTATKDSDAGTYIISGSGAEANNCAFKYINGVFTINKAKQVLDCSVKDRDVTIEVDKSLEFVFSNVVLSPIECKVSDEEILGITVNENHSFGITALKEGYATLTFTQSGDKNYEAATLVFYVTTTVSGLQKVVNVNDIEVYDLLGRKVENTSNLKGIYIVNGRKTIF